MKNKILTIVFLIIIIGIFILNIIVKDKELSEAERRKLKQIDDISISNFSDDFEDYVLDQMIFRDSLRKIKTWFHLNILNQNNVNGYYVKDEIIYKEEYPLNESSVINLTEQIKNIKDSYLDESNNIYYSIIPDKNYFLDNSTKYLKMDYSKLEKIMNQKLNDMKYIDILDLLNINDYYKTDTHWKQENLIKVAKEISNQMDFYLNENYVVKSQGEFEGVYYGQIGIVKEKDELKYIINNDILNSIVYNYEKNVLTNVYDENGLNTLDKYNYYLSGATPLLKITNNIAKENKRLIVFRDSFGSSIIPLFISGYKEIIVVDTRYISKQILKNYIDFGNSDILFLYSTLIINQSSSLK